MSSKIFPIMLSGYVSEVKEIYGKITGPIYTNVDWAMIAPFEEQARRNHGGQTLARLASRGGLGVAEAVAVLERRAYRPLLLQEACTALHRHVVEWENRRRRGIDDMLNDPDVMGV